MKDWKSLAHTKWECKYHVWIRGYCVSTIGLDEEKVRKYIREQEKLDLEQQGQKCLGIDNEF